MIVSVSSILVIPAIIIIVPSLTFTTVSDSELRDCENVPLAEDVDEYFRREVLPHVPDARMDRSKDRVGYEINCTKEFYKYKPLRALEEIRKDILALEKETEGLMGEVLES